MQQTSIEELREKLLEEARKKAEEMLKKAEEEARKIIEEAEREWSKRADEERSRIISEAEMKAQIEISDAKRRARMLINQAKVEVFNKIFEEVEKALRERRGFDIRESLEKLLDECLTYVEKPKYVIVNSKDRGVIEDILRNHGLEAVEVKVSDNIYGGVIVESHDGKRVDNSYNTRLKRARTVFAPMINRELWG